MGIMILVRHGVIDKKDKFFDTLTPKAKDCVKLLPRLLSDEGYDDIDAVYYDNSKKEVDGISKKINRGE